MAKRRYDAINIDGHSAEAIGYTLMKMHEAGLITGEIIRSKSTPERVIEVMPFELTFKGHEFLDSICDPAIWKKTKDGAKKVGSTSLEFAWELAKAYGKHVAKERLGVDL